MRIRKIEIKEWRNFRDISIDLPEEASLVCLVGANGTGKTHILELISACAHHLGLSSGIEIPRGNPFSDSIRNFSVQIFLAPRVSSTLDALVASTQGFDTWDRTLTVEGPKSTISVGGISDAALSQKLAKQVVTALRDLEEVHHLTLDADRAFPKRDMPIHELAQAFETQWESAQWSKGRAFQTTRTLYDEWIKYCLAKENDAANQHFQAVRRAAEGLGASPEFKDPFSTFKNSLRQVMPHLLFAGADQKRKAILFDTSGMELRFDQLSGGEREIAFLIGQIDRFGLRNGLFLLDEPELHLNPDLVRSWVTYLGNTVNTGQVWLATHSLEAVEAAGISSTILLERDGGSRTVSKAANLADEPVQSALSRAVGTPAFSISALRFVFIEGEEAIGERERYRRVTGLSADTRFLECGSCTEVVRKVAVINALAKEAGQKIRIAGVVDRDWRSKTEIELMAAQENISVLPVHEVENFFIHPGTLTSIAKQIGHTSFDYGVELVSACDNRAGGWIVQSALSDNSQSDISDLPPKARAHAYGLGWPAIESDMDAAMQRIVDFSELDDKLKPRLKRRLMTYAEVYSRKRTGEELWKICEGKEIMKALARALGFSDHHALERAVTALWDTGPSNVPHALREFRKELTAK